MFVERISFIRIVVLLLFSAVSTVVIVVFFSLQAHAFVEIAMPNIECDY